MHESDPTIPKRADEGVPDAAADAYEAPAIEAALTAEELEREVLYAGNFSAVFC